MPEEYYLPFRKIKEGTFSWKEDLIQTGADLKKYHLELAVTGTGYSILCIRKLQELQRGYEPTNIMDIVGTVLAIIGLAFFIDKADNYKSIDDLRKSLFEDLLPKEVSENNIKLKTLDDKISNQS